MLTFTDNAGIFILEVVLLPLCRCCYIIAVVLLMFCYCCCGTATALVGMHQEVFSAINFLPWQQWVLFAVVVVVAAVVVTVAVVVAAVVAAVVVTVTVATLFHGH